VRARSRIFWAIAALATAAVIWALNVELTFEQNLHRGIPADLRLHSTHRPVNWKI